MQHSWGRPMDLGQAEEISLLEAQALKAGHRQIWTGAWYCCNCKTIYCEHCVGIDIGSSECPGSRLDEPWKLAKGIL